jgi:DNA-binding transcriptional MocR family regulator
VPTDVSTREPIAWESLVARGLRSPALARADRFALRGAGPDAIDLANQQPSPDLLPHDALRASLDAVLSDARALGYAPTQGVPALRAAVARDLVASGMAVDESDVVITSGSQQALDVLLRVLVDPGDAFLVEPATYPAVLHLLAFAGARLEDVRVDEHGVVVDELPKGLRAKGLYLMPGFHNPTGVRTSGARREALVAWSRETGTPVVEDDYDADLDLDDDPPLPRLRALDAEVCHVGTYSKKLVPALRLGYLVCPAPVRARVLQVKAALDVGTSALLQHALADLLARGVLREHLARVRAAYRARRDALETALREALPPEVTWRRPRRGLFLWIPLPGASPERLFEECRRRGVLVRPSPLFAVGESSAPGLRLAFCREPVERLVEGARRVADAVRAAR